MTSLCRCPLPAFLRRLSAGIPLIVCILSPLVFLFLLNIVTRCLAPLTLLRLLNPSQFPLDFLLVS